MKTINFQKIALQYAQTQTQKEREELNMEVKKWMQEYLNVTDPQILKKRIDEIYTQISNGLDFLKDMIEKDKTIV